MNQVSHVVVQNTKRKLLVGCLTLLLGLPLIACCLFFMISVLLPKLENFTGSVQSDSIPVIFLIIGITIISILLLIPVLAVALITQKRARMLDSIFKPLGLQGKFFMLIGRHYWGDFAGRPLDIYIYRGPTVEIRLAAQSKSQILIFPKTSLPTKISGILQNKPLDITNPLYAPFTIYAEDHDWAQNFLALQNMETNLHSLVFEHTDWAIFRHVEIQPADVMLYLHRSKKLFVAQDQFFAVQTWLKNLSEVADRVETLPTPAKPLPPNRNMSRMERQKKSNFLLYVVIAILIGLPLCLIGIGILTYVLVL